MLEAAGIALTGVPVSVVVVSQRSAGPADDLPRSLVRQSHDAFEIVVVADREARRRVDRSPRSSTGSRWCPFDAPGISAARNARIAQAAGEVVAFIDGTTPRRNRCGSASGGGLSEDDRVSAATGYVRGRNVAELPAPHLRRRAGRGPEASFPARRDVSRRIVATSEGRAIKTEGTNMAFRRSVLHEVNGVRSGLWLLPRRDGPRHVGWREYGRADRRPFLVAQVLHGVARARGRRSDRVPAQPSSTWVRASRGSFRRHSRREDHIAHRATGAAERRAGLLAHNGRRADRTARRGSHPAEASTRAGPRGWNAIDRARPAARGCREASFCLTGPTADGAGTSSCRGPLLAGPAPPRGGRASGGARHDVTLLLLSPTARPHRAWFDPQGYWVQAGGVPGRAEREEQVVRLRGFHLSRGAGNGTCGSAAGDTFRIGCSLIGADRQDRPVHAMRRTYKGWIMPRSAPYRTGAGTLAGPADHLGDCDYGEARDEGDLSCCGIGDPVPASDEIRPEGDHDPR